jgi:hypothetical protein
VTSSHPSSRWTESFRLRQAAASVLLVALGWLCTGTLASYAVGLDIAIVWRPCGYLLNCDHGQFVASHLMLDGAPRATWEGSVVLRRTLYPLLAYPFAKVLGFEYGGILANFLLALATLIGFSEYIRRKVGNAGATAAALLIATYPGIHYWVGLPYSYAVIVPSSLAATAILWELQDEDRIPRIALLSLALGILYVGYDLAPFFAPAALALVWMRTRGGRATLVSTVLQAMPSGVNLLVLAVWLDVPLQNSNTSAYWAVLRSFGNPGDPAIWAGKILPAPYLLAENFLASNFVWLPLLFVACVAASRLRSWTTVYPFERAILICALAIWALNNLAPPYPGKWQMRGEWIARLYQPVLGVLLTFVSRSVQVAAGRGRAWRRAVLVALVATAGMNALVMVGPFVGGGRYTALMYEAFYAHAPPGSDYQRPGAQPMLDHLEKLGRRPLGFCRQ